MRIILLVFGVLFSFALVLVGAVSPETMAYIVGVPAAISLVFVFSETGRVFLGIQTREDFKDMAQFFAVVPVVLAVMTIIFGVWAKLT